MPRKTALPSIGRRLASARMRRGLSQGTASRLAGIAPSYLSRIETGRVQPTFRTVQKIASALSISAEELVGPEPRKQETGACPVTLSGSCMLDLIRSDAQVTRVASGEVYTTREVRLLQRLATWMRVASPERLRAMEIVLDDLLRGVPATKKA